MMSGLIAVIAVIVAASSGLTALLHVSFRQQRYLKYATVLLFLGVGLYNLVLSRTAPTEGFQRLGRWLYGLMGLGASFVSLVTALLLDGRASH